jgi:hypothetical protein
VIFLSAASSLYQEWATIQLDAERAQYGDIIRVAKIRQD